MNMIRGKLLSGTPATLLVVLIVPVLAGVAGAESPVTVPAGNLELTFNGGFAPKALSKTVPTPIALNFSGQIKTVDGTHPPALTEFLLEIDKNGAIDVKGLPACPLRRNPDFGDPREICKNAVIGRGMMNIDIAFPEQLPFTRPVNLVIFNGGVKEGVTTLYVYGFVAAPVSAVIAMPVKITKIHNGRFDTKALISVSKIAGGYGSVTSVSATIDRQFSYRGKRLSVLALKCPDGKIRVRSEAIFSDETHANAEVLRACTPKG